MSKANGKSRQFHSVPPIAPISPRNSMRPLPTGRIGNLSRLPKQLRFFAGGDNSVRGYGFESLGERNAAGAVVGGKHLLTGSIEYEHPVRDDWGLALFVDTGNAFNDWDSIDLKTGAGFGARWKSPIGPVRVDVAWPVDDFSDPHLHLNIGPDL